MKTENIVALSFVLGAISGIGIFVWIVFYPLPSWSNDNHFTNFSKDCIISDIGAAYQVDNCDAIFSFCHLEWEADKQGDYKTWKLAQFGKARYEALERRARSIIRFVAFEPAPLQVEQQIAPVLRAQHPCRAAQPAPRRSRRSRYPSGKGSAAASRSTLTGACRAAGSTRPWMPQDDAQLLASLESKMDRDLIARKLKRTVLAVSGRLRVLRAAGVKVPK
jgi:hypothetical protein